MKDKSLTDINKLWEYVCNGNVEKLKEYYTSGGSANKRYSKFGEDHSLLMGAFRNNQFETVEYLMSEGERLSPKEIVEIKTELRKFGLMQKLAEPEEQESDMGMDMTHGM